MSATTPVERLATPDTPIPHGPPHEDGHVPDAGRIAAEISSHLGSR